MKTLCVFCFGSSHKADVCPKKAAGWKSCDVQNCGRWHSRWLHGATTPGLVLAVAAATDGPASTNVLLLCQRIPTAGGPSCLTFWDHGSNTALVTFDYAERAGLVGTSCRLELTVAGEKKETLVTKIFVVPLLDREGNRKEVCAFGLHRITTDVKVYGLEDVVGLFNDLTMENIDPPDGPVDLLVGLGRADLLPVQLELVDKLAVFTSRFGTGYMVAGSHKDIFVMGERESKACTVSYIEARNLRPLDFLTAEAVGTDVPRRCRSCKNCKECDFKVRSLTWKENAELAQIEKGLSLDPVARKWTAAYPFEKDPEELQDNYGQAAACMESLERRLRKTGRLAEFNDQIADTVSRGVFKELSQEEADEYKGPVNYITIVETFKSGPLATTPIRLCMNSSMKFRGVSLNDLLVKGPSALNDIFGVTLGFRRHKVGFVKDLSKFYQSVLSCKRDQHLRRILWRDGDSGKKPKVYVTTTVNFGDKPAGCVAQTAVRETAKLYRQIDEAAADLIVSATFCDDTLGGGDSRRQAEQISRNMDQIVAMGGFIYKDTVMSGDHSELGEHRKVLGLGWDETKDELYVDVKVNVSAKKKGLRVEPDLELGEIVQLLPVVITKRTVWRIVLGQYDILGLVCVFLIRLKLIMRELSSEDGRKIEWDEPVPAETREKFAGILACMERMKDVRFPRCVVPDGSDPQEEPDLLCFADGSTSAFCCLVYGRWKLVGGGFGCRLIAGKARVAPLRKISVPRLELQGAVAAVRLVQQVEQFLGLQFKQRFFFTDSSAVLGMLRSESASFQEFVGTRVSEIKSKSNPLTEWFWVPTHENVADLGTRESVEPADMMAGSRYQSGPDWAQKEVVDWPTNQSFGKPPEEELKKKGMVMLVKEQKELIDFQRFKSFSQLKRTMAYVFHFLESIKRSMISGGLQEAELPPEADNKKEVVVVLNRRVLEQAEKFLMAHAQTDVRSGLKTKKYDSLLPRILRVADSRGVEVDTVVVSGRLGDNLVVGYDKTELPLLEYSHPMSKLIMRECHEMDHGGLDRTLMRTRNLVWIVRGRALAKVVKANCFGCKLRAKVLQQQIMAPLPESRLPPAPVFHSTAVDLFGPITIRDTVKKRVSGKCWGVIFCCTVTSAIHLEVTEDYSCDSFLLCLRRFMNLRGTPARIQSDPGEQLMAAAAELGRWDYSKIIEWTNGQQVEWHKIPAGSQHFNGTAESMIRVTKLQLTGMLKERSCTKGELDTLMSDVAYLVNSRPLMVKAGSDPWAGGPVTPLHLLGGRATIGVPAIGLDERPTLTKRLRFLEELKQQFWKKWFAQVFSHLVPCQKWRTEHRDVKKGDVVLLREDNVVQDSYKLARVKQTLPGVDGRVRRVILEYKNVKSGVPIDQMRFRETERSIHNLVVIVPVDWTPEQIEEAVLTAEDENSRNLTSE